MSTFNKYFVIFFLNMPFEQKTNLVFTAGPSSAACNIFHGGDRIATASHVSSTASSSPSTVKSHPPPKSDPVERAKHDYTQNCCADHCLWKFTLQQCVESHEWYMKQPTTWTRNWLKTVIIASSDEANKVHLRFAGHPVCHTAFKHLYGLSNNKFSQALKDAQTPRTMITHGNICNHNAEKPGKKSLMHAWVDEFLNSSGDTDPISGHVHIPSYLTKDSLYEMFMEDCNLEGTPSSTIPSYASFFRYFDLHFSHVRFLKHTRLGRCTFCMEYQERRRKITNPQELVDFKEAAKQHHLLHSTERTMYESRSKQAQQHPSDFVSIIVDCPQGYQVPHKQPVTKDSWAAKKVPVDAVGSICHTTEERCFYFYLPFWPKGPNLIITVLFLQIVAALAHLGKNGCNPPVLWLQLDNSSRENKNKWVLAFLFWLVHCGWFFEIVVSFLPPGHTHVDIDQMFSTLAIWLLTHSVQFITDLVRKLCKAFKYCSPVPTGCFLSTVYNWKGFLAGHMCSIKGLSKPHVFLIRRLDDGSVGMKCKKWHSSKQGWRGPSVDDESWLYLMNSYPTGCPSLLQRGDLQMEATLESVSRMMQLKPSSLSLWEQFFSDHKATIPHEAIIPSDLFHMTRVRYHNQ
jgi:hypothetical protein